MGLSVITGPNGSGKTLYAVRAILEELLHGNRCIGTSVALDLAALSEYCSEHYPEKKIDVWSRVWLLTPDQMRIFWRTRGPFRFGEYGRECLTLEKYGTPCWSTSFGAMLYVLDEVQTVFNSRSWSSTGHEFCDYQSQHRHFGDDVVAITPALSLIEKQFRVLAAETVILRNLYKMRVGMLKASRKIIFQTYASCPPQPGEEPMMKGSFTIDAAGLARCYDTSAGVGVVGGRDADKGKESGGIRWQWAVGACCILAVIAFFVLRGASHAVMRRGVKAVSVGSGSTPTVPARAVSGRSEAVPAKPVVTTPFHEGIETGLYPTTKATNDVRIRGWGSADGGRTWVVETEAGIFGAGRVVPRLAGIEVDGVMYKKAPVPERGRSVANVRGPIIGQAVLMR